MQPIRINGNVQRKQNNAKAQKAQSRKYYATYHNDPFRSPVFQMQTKLTNKNTNHVLANPIKILTIDVNLRI